MEVKIKDNSLVVISKIREDLLRFENYKIRPIEDSKSAKKAGDLLKGAKTFRDEIEAKRKEIVKPFKDPAAEIDKLVKPYRDVLDAFITELSGLIYVYKKEQNEKLLAEENERRLLEIETLISKKEELIKESIETGSSLIAMEAAKIGNEIDKIANGEIYGYNGIRSSYSLTTVKEKWTDKIINSSKVPKQYLEPSDKLIKEALKDGVRSIKGLEIIDIGTVRSS